MMLVFILGSFAATYSTAFNYFDGWPRVVGACARKRAMLDFGRDKIVSEYESLYEELIEDGSEIGRD